MAAAGVSPAEIEAELGARRLQQSAQAAQREEVIDVWPEHHATWDVWRELENQWRVVSGFSGGGYQGLEFASIPVALEIVGVRKKARRQVMKNLSYMESEALAVLNGKEGDGK